MSRQPIKSEAALAAFSALSVARVMKRPALERAMSALGRRIIRVRGGGRSGGIYLA